MGRRLTSGELRGFYEAGYGRVLGAVSLVTGSRAAAEDAVHEALARAWERGDRIEHLERWVMTVALNLARNRWRRTRREDLGPGPEGAVDAADGDEIDLRRALAALPVRQREVVVLHYLFDKPVAEVAAIVGLTPGGTKHALFRARRSLATALAPADEEVS